MYCTCLRGQLLAPRRERLEILVERVVAHTGRLIRIDRLQLLLLPLPTKRLIRILELIIFLAKLIPLRSVYSRTHDQKWKTFRGK